jgi:hypothetical protein
MNQGKKVSSPTLYPPSLGLWMTTFSCCQLSRGKEKRGLEKMGGKKAH